MCDSPYENIAQGAQWQFYLGATSRPATAADSHLGSPVGTFFACKASLCVCTVSVVPLCGHFVPKVGPKTPQGGQKVQKGAQKLTFRSLKRHFWVPSW